MLTDPTPDSTVDVSVVLPCHNEERSLRLELDRITTALTTSGRRFEIVVVDDGSTDDTRHILRTSDIANLRLIRLETRHGAGTARRIGTLAARGDIVIWTDCDLTYPNEQIADLAATLESDPTLEQVIGARTREAGTAPRLRGTVKATIRRYVAHRLSCPIDDLNSGMRAFYRSSATQTMPLLPPGFSCTTTMTVSFILQGRGVGYLPIPYVERVGRSKFHPVTDTYRLLRQVHRVIRAHRAADEPTHPATTRSQPSPTG
jgi:glycosyltransferase involved in cell wall biosynthesis